jgi:hypothetical protein
VAEYLRQAASEAGCCWHAYERSYPGEPLAQIRAWLAEMAQHLANSGKRGSVRSPMLRSNRRTRLIRGGRVRSRGAIA